MKKHRINKCATLTLIIAFLLLFFTISQYRYECKSTVHLHLSFLVVSLWDRGRNTYLRHPFSSLRARIVTNAFSPPDNAFFPGGHFTNMTNHLSSYRFLHSQTLRPTIDVLVRKLFPWNVLYLNHSRRVTLVFTRIFSRIQNKRNLTWNTPPVHFSINPKTLSLTITAYLLWRSGWFAGDEHHDRCDQRPHLSCTSIHGMAFHNQSLY